LTDGDTIIDGSSDRGHLVLTFSGLDDSLTYDLTGGFDSNNNNFNAIWQADGQTFTTATVGNVGYGTLNNLQTDGSGNLVINIIRTGNDSGHITVAGLSLEAVAFTPPVEVDTSLPRMLDLAFDEAGDLLISLDKAGSNFIVEQSDDLATFTPINFTIEGVNNDILRIQEIENIDPNNDGKSFVRLARQPNFIIVPTIQTPRIDAMASEGIRFTDFYAQVVCGPSRDALLTGCYPLRTAHHSNAADRTSPHPQLALSEITLAELLRDQGYATAAYGKWDLEGRFEFEDAANGPTGQGFDSYFRTTAGDPTATQSSTDQALSFIQSNRDQPFFAYVAYSMPHIELATSPDFTNFTGNGIYPDVMAEIDFNVGRILDTVAAEGLDEVTYIMFISDNGPWYLGNSQVHIDRYGGSAEAEEMGGSALPLRGDKTTSWDGGFRVPSIMRAPGRIPSGQVSSEIATTLDVMPTIIKLAGGTVPTDRVIDGHDISAIIHGEEDAESPTEAFFYYVRENLHAVRVGKWKLHVPHPLDTFWERFYRTGDYFLITQPLLYDLEADIGETTDVSAANPSIVNELMEHINFARTDIGDTNQIGINAR